MNKSTTGNPTFAINKRNLTPYILAVLLAASEVVYKIVKFAMFNIPLSELFTQQTVLFPIMLAIITLIMLLLKPKNPYWLGLPIVVRIAYTIKLVFEDAVLALEIFKYVEFEASMHLFKIALRSLFLLTLLCILLIVFILAIRNKQYFGVFTGASFLFAIIIFVSYNIYPYSTPSVNRFIFSYITCNIFLIYAFIALIMKKNTLEEGYSSQINSK